MIEGQTVVHEVTYPHPPERVWQALVDADEMALWFMPNDGFVPVVATNSRLPAIPTAWSKPRSSNSIRRSACGAGGSGRSERRW